LVCLFVFGRTINIHCIGLRIEWMLLEWKWNNIRRFIYGIGQWNGRTVRSYQLPINYHIISFQSFTISIHNFNSKEDVIWWYWRQCSCWNEMKWNRWYWYDKRTVIWYEYMGGSLCEITTNHRETGNRYEKEEIW